MPHRFRAVIYKVGINRCVDVPAALVARLDREGLPYISVTALAAGHIFPATLLPRGGGERRLFLNGAVRKAIGVDTGDQVEITLALDPKPRDPAIHADLAAALDRKEGAWERFELLPPGLRREALQWIGKAKGSATRAARIRKLLERMEST